MTRAPSDIHESHIRSAAQFMEGLDTSSHVLLEQVQPRFLFGCKQALPALVRRRIDGNPGLKQTDIGKQVDLDSSSFSEFLRKGNIHWEKRKKLLGLDEMAGIRESLTPTVQAYIGYQYTTSWVYWHILGGGPYDAHTDAIKKKVIPLFPRGDFEFCYYGHLSEYRPDSDFDELYLKVPEPIRRAHPECTSLWFGKLMDSSKRLAFSIAFSEIQDGPKF